MLIILGEDQLDRLISRMGQYTHRRNVLNACHDPMMTVGRMVAARAKVNVLATPSKGQNARRGKPSLRRGISGAIQVRKENSRDAAMVNIFVNPSKMPVGKYGLGSLYEGVSEWHHPVYGHEPVLYQAPHPYMATADQGAHAALEVAANITVNKIARSIDTF